MSNICTFNANSKMWYSMFLFLQQIPHARLLNLKKNKHNRQNLAGPTRGISLLIMNVNNLSEGFLLWLRPVWYSEAHTETSTLHHIPQKPAYIISFYKLFGRFWVHYTIFVKKVSEHWQTHTRTVGSDFGPQNLIHTKHAKTRRPNETFFSHWFESQVAKHNQYTP